MSAPRFRSVEAELQRARAARRVLPWVATTAAGAALLLGVAARTGRAAFAIALPIAILAGIVWLMATPRCPSCSGSLLRRGERPGSAGNPRQVEAERTRRCPRCGIQFE